MHDALAGAHALDFAAADDPAVAQAVLVRQRAGKDVGDDLHVTVAVHAEAGTGCDAILVDDAQRAPTHFCRIVIFGEGKAVPGLQPAVIGITALVGGATLDHGNSL